jgi:hypothetical protein
MGRSQGGAEGESSTVWSSTARDGARPVADLPHRIGTAVLVGIPLALSALVYFPITRNYFFADDFLHLFRIRNEDLLPFLLVPRGGHLLVSYNAFFYLSYLLFGTHPEPYFWVALLTHLLNVGLLFSVIRLFTQSARLASFGAALWGISPMSEQAVGWFSVFGQLMVATVLLVVLRQLALVADGRPLGRYAPLRWCVLLLIACTSFGIGIGLTLVFPIVAFLLLPASPARTRVAIGFCVLAVAVPALYFGLTSLTTALYMPRTTPVFTEPNLMTNLTMLTFLLGYGIVTLVVGHLTSQLAYPGPFATLVIALFAAGMVITLLTAPWPLKRRLLACIVLALGCYGIIVVGRAAFFAIAGRPEAFIRPGRYHYVAPIPLALALCVMLAHADQLLRLRPAVKNGLLAAWIGVAGLAWFWVGKPVDQHFHARRETTAVLASLRQAIDAAAPQQDVTIPIRRFQSLGPIFASRLDIFPGWAGVFVIFYPDNVVDGKRVRFVTADREALIAAAEGHRTATLIVPPPEG